jgi:hypothetical protein
MNELFYYTALTHRGYVTEPSASYLDPDNEYHDITISLKMGENTVLFSERKLCYLYRFEAKNN